MRAPPEAPPLRVQAAARHLQRAHHRRAALRAEVGLQPPRVSLRRARDARCAQRVGEMREPPLGLEEVPHPALEQFFDEILAAPSTDALVGRTLRVRAAGARGGARPVRRGHEPARRRAEPARLPVRPPRGRRHARLRRARARGALPADERSAEPRRVDGIARGAASRPPAASMAARRAPPQRRPAGTRQRRTSTTRCRGATSGSPTRTTWA